MLCFAPFCKIKWKCEEAYGAIHSGDPTACVISSSAFWVLDLALANPKSLILGIIAVGMTPSNKTLWLFKSR